MRFSAKAVKATVDRLTQAGYVVEFESRKEDNTVALAGNSDTGALIEIFKDGSTSGDEPKRTTT